MPEIFNSALMSPNLTGVLPAGFQEQVAIPSLSQPTDVQFAPNGHVFVTEKDGVILEYDSLSDTTPTVFADLSVEVMNYWDRGLTSFAIDPGLTTGRPYLYVLYAYDAPIGGTAPTYGGTNLMDSCPTPPGPLPPNTGCVISGRLSRLTVSNNGAGGTMVAGSEKVLVNAWCQQFPSHTPDDVEWGPDGQLWVTAGDGAAFTTRDWGQYSNPCGDPPGAAGTNLSLPTAEGGSLRAQDALTPGDPQALSGSMIRVNPDTGLGSAGNPDASSSDPNLARLVADGLRNPFRMTFRPGTSEAWIGMVGDSTWESVMRDVNPTAGITDFGWPCYEGPALGAFNTLNLNMCKTLYNNPSLVTKPYYAYNHSASVVTGDGCTTGSSSISGMAFGVPSNYPSHYNGGLFFADYSRNCIWFMPAGSNGLPDPTKVETFETNATGPVQLIMGPDGNLYYTDYGGSIRRIIYSAVNHTPVASFTASATYGPTPLAVTFDASGSTDADKGDTLSYSWDLNGDGTYGDATGVTASKTYTTRGKITVRLKVTDNHGASSTSSITLFPGDTPPVVTLVSPLEHADLEGRRRDPDDRLGDRCRGRHAAQLGLQLGDHPAPLLHPDQLSHPRPDRIHRAVGPADRAGPWLPVLPRHRDHGHRQRWDGRDPDRPALSQDGQPDLPDQPARPAGLRRRQRAERVHADHPPGDHRLDGVGQRTDATGP